MFALIRKKETKHTRKHLHKVKKKQTSKEYQTKKESGRRDLYMMEKVYATPFRDP